MRLKSILVVFFLIASLFLFFQISKTNAQTPPPSPDCWFIGSTRPQLGEPICNRPEFGPIYSGTNSCKEGGSNTGNFCCSTANAYCTTVQADIARRENVYCCPNRPTPTPIPPCVLNGGQCIPLSPCSLGRVPSSFSCGGSGVCCVVPTPTPTPTPTPRAF